ncbi:MAG: hypothetical protein Q7U10_12140 [Thermodesulfovibrionia bacterium]|nr:hypothetical protein [Thermodesulfovibrionia bacterium]
MKGLFAALTAVLLLSVTSVTYAHDTRHERERASSRYEAPVMVTVIFDNARGSAFGMRQYDQRHRGRPAFMKHRPFWKKMQYIQMVDNRNDRYDRHDRDDRNDRNDRHDERNWYDQYFQ